MLAVLIVEICKTVSTCLKRSFLGLGIQGKRTFVKFSAHPNSTYNLLNSS